MSEEFSSIPFIIASLAPARGQTPCNSGGLTLAQCVFRARVNNKWPSPHTMSPEFPHPGSTWPNLVAQLIRPQLLLLLPGTQEGPELSEGRRSGASGVHSRLLPRGLRLAHSVGAGVLQRGLLGDGQQLCRSLLFPSTLGKWGRDRRHWTSYSLSSAHKKSALSC